jgi:NADPH2:quinone reductase
MKYLQTESLALTETSRPTPKSDELLIRVVAAGVNRPDILQRKGAYPPPPGASPILGLEVSGLVEELGVSVTKFKKGDSVCALVSGGGYATFCVAPEAQCLPVPEGMSLIEAAGVPENYFTVWANVFQRGKLAQGESLLVHGGTSGIGTTAIQLAKAFGASAIYTTAGTDEKCAAAIQLGATRAVNYRTHDFVQEIQKFTDSKGVNLILDMVGGSYFEKNLAVLASEGRLVQIATQQGSEVKLNLRNMMSKAMTITGSALRPRSAAQKGAIAQELYEKVWPLFVSKKVKVIVAKTFSFSEAAEAHELMESSHHIGKIILTT